MYVNLYAAGKGDLKVGDNAVTISQETRYPWDGVVTMTVDPKEECRFALKVRIPGWSQNTPVPSDLYKYMTSSSEKESLKLNGKPVTLPIEKGYVTFDRTWKKGDTVELDLPMPVRRVTANEKVEADRNRVAVERGPIVFCAEWPDNNGNTHGLILPDDAKLTSEFRKEMLGGIEVIEGKALAATPGEEDQPMVTAEHDLLLIPYYAWAHRGKGQMDVWLGRNTEAIEASSKK